MHASPPEDHGTFPPPGGGTPALAGASGAPSVDAIMAGSAAPPPVSRRSRRRAERVARRPHVTKVSGGNSSPAMRMLMVGLVAIVGIGAIAVGTGLVPLGGPPGTEGQPRGRDMDGSWSYYHDRDYETGSNGAKWSTDRSRSTDPDEAALGDTSRWEYDGPYRYGPYGSDGMSRRTSGREDRDPLYSQPTPMQDVFSAHGDLDPSGGQPVGVAPSSMTNPYYDPYAGYSNPYANRIRLAYGEGVGRGANYDPYEGGY